MIIIVACHVIQVLFLLTFFSFTYALTYENGIICSNIIYIVHLFFFVYILNALHNFSVLYAYIYLFDYDTAFNKIQSYQNDIYFR